MTRSGRPLTALLLAATLCAPPAGAAPAGTAFTYQGRLIENGTPPTGPYDLQFTLYDVPAGGVALFPPVVVDDVAVAAGLFTVSLDFGASAFTGDARFMEIGVRPGASGGPFTPLSGRQELRPAPNSLAAPWAGVHGKPAGFADDVDNDVLGALACAGGELAKWNGSAWACAPDADSGGDITDVVAAPGGGLVGGAASGSAALGLLTSCPANQLLKWNGAAWACAADADSGGDITGVTAGTGLSGGGTSGAVTLQANFAGTGAATTVSHSDHDHYGQTWSGSSSWSLRLLNAFTGSTNGLRAETTDPAASSYGVYGISNSSAGKGVVGYASATTGVAWGVYGFSASSIGHGVSGHATSTFGDVRGVSAFINSTEGAAIDGFANNPTGTADGVIGDTNAPQGVGVFGGGGIYGVYGFAQASAGIGVFGWNQATFGPTFGLSGLVYSTAGTGVKGDNTSLTGPTYGVYGHTSSGSGRAIQGVSGSASASAYAGYFTGQVHVQGTLSKSAGSFKIDHPLDPENKYLYHSFVESPDMKNIYDGTVTTDALGFATVALPSWFTALNRDFRYQLTVVDSSDSFVLAKVSREIEDGRFTVRTSLAGIKVSWQVTGIRKDPYAERHRIPVEQDKPEDERGRYLDPELYGQPPERGLDYERERAASASATPMRMPPTPHRLPDLEEPGGDAPADGPQ